MELAKLFVQQTFVQAVLTQIFVQLASKVILQMVMAVKNVQMLLFVFPVNRTTDNSAPNVMMDIT